MLYHRIPKEFLIPLPSTHLSTQPPHITIDRDLLRTQIQVAVHGNKKSRATLISLVESGLTVSRELVEKKRFELSTPTLRT